MKNRKFLIALSILSTLGVSSAYADTINRENHGVVCQADAYQACANTRGHGGAGSENRNCIYSIQLALNGMSPDEIEESVKDQINAACGDGRKDCGRAALDKLQEEHGYAMSYVQACQEGIDGDNDWYKHHGWDHDRFHRWWDHCHNNEEFHRLKDKIKVLSAENAHLLAQPSACSADRSGKPGVPAGSPLRGTGSSTDGSGN